MCMKDGEKVKSAEVKEIIRAGFAWANWTEEQKKAFAIAYESIDKLERLELDYQQLNREWLELAKFKQRAEKKLTEQQLNEIQYDE